MDERMRFVIRLQDGESMAALCREFDIELPLATIFTHPTLGELASAAEDRILADVTEDTGDPAAGAAEPRRAGPRPVP